MTRLNYDLIREAILSKKQITCFYDGHYREICPHVLGWGKEGNEQVLAFQFAGTSSRGLPPDGEWRCLQVRQLHNVTSRDGAWRTRDKHTRPQTCVKRIDVEVDL